MRCNLTFTKQDRANSDALSFNRGGLGATVVTNAFGDQSRRSRRKLLKRCWTRRCFASVRVGAGGRRLARFP